MTSRISHTTIDSQDAFALSEWWRQALGYVDVADDPNEEGDEECKIFDPQSGHTLLFVQVEKLKPASGRLHFDLVSRDDDRDSELDRLLAHGAVLVADHRGIHGPGSGWVTLADPEGNVFDIVRS